MNPSVSAEGQSLPVQDSANVATAERCFRTAIEVVRKQRAKSWDLRATINLAQMLIKKGEREEARAMLAEIHNSCTQGFQITDLKDAKALLV